MSDNMSDREEPPAGAVPQVRLLAAGLQVHQAVSGAAGQERGWLRHGVVDVLTVGQVQGHYFRWDEQWDRRNTKRGGTEREHFSKPCRLQCTCGCVRAVNGLRPISSHVVWQAAQQ